MWSAILAKELISRLQSRLAYAILTVLVTSFALLTMAAFWLIVATVPTIVPVIGSSVGSGSGTTFPTLVIGYRGVFLFLAMGLSVLTALCVIVPAVSSAAIASEHQENTFDLLIASGASGRSLVTGKIAAATLFILLLMLTTLPGFTVAWYYGGVNWAEIGPILMLVASTLFFLVCGGVFISSFTQSPVIAALYAYCGVFLLTFGTLAVYFIGASVSMEPIVRPILVLNPFTSLLTVPDQISAQVAQVLPFQYRPILEQAAFDFGGSALRLPRWVATTIVFIIGGMVLALCSAIMIDPFDRIKARFLVRPTLIREAA